MLILIPWKPVAVTWGLLSGMLLFGFIVSSLMEGKNPFAPHLTQMHNTVVRQSAMHTSQPRKSVHKTSPPTTK
jgi:hypothetical protein